MSSEPEVCLDYCMMGRNNLIIDNPLSFLYTFSTSLQASITAHVRTVTSCSLCYNDYSSVKTQPHNMLLSPRLQPRPRYPTHTPTHTYILPSDAA